MGSYRGKVIMNYAYSWGAAVVILGTLFKLTHTSGANLMLWVGMGTEVLVFFLSAFDLPNKNGTAQNAGTATNGAPAINISGAAATTQSEPEAPGITFGSAPTNGNAGMPTHITVVGGGGGSTPSQHLPEVSPEMEEATTAYLVQLKEMTETLARLTTQADVLGKDADQMTLLSKNLSGINAIYEMQLRSVSSQIGTIDQVHEQTRRMAQQIEDLNAVYARMLEAMSGNSK